MTEYKVVFNREGEAFDEMVSSCLNDGWELYGNPWSHQEPTSGVVHLYQTIIREYTYVSEDEEYEEEETEIEQEATETVNIPLPPTENNIRPLE